jgi:hypothetical protein
MQYRLVLISIRSWINPRAMVKLERWDKLKKSSNFIGTWTCNLPACSTAAQPSMIPRTLLQYLVMSTISRGKKGMSSASCDFVLFVLMSVYKVLSLLWVKDSRSKKLYSVWWPSLSITYSMALEPRMTSQYSIRQIKVTSNTGTRKIFMYVCGIYQGLSQLRKIKNSSYSQTFLLWDLSTRNRRN